MMSLRSLKALLPIACAAGALAGCGGDTRKAASAADSASAMDAASAEWQAKRSKVVDSIFRAAPTVAQVARQKGSMYDVADAALTAAVVREAEKTRYCYTNALRDYDPGLAGVVEVLVNFGAAGWDIVRVEHSSWTSVAGGAAESCINAHAKTEWKLPTKGVKPGAHLVQLKFRPDSAGAKGK